MADNPPDEQTDIDGLWYPANATIQFIWIGVGLQGSLNLSLLGIASKVRRAA